MSNALDPASAQQMRDRQLAAEIDFASNYRVFVEDKRATAILAQMARSLNGRAVGAHISHGEVMYHEGQRAVFLGILTQIEKSNAKPPVDVDPFAIE